MESLTPRKIAFRAGLISALALFFLLLPFSIFKLEWPFNFVILLLPLLFFLATYSIFYYLMERFIDQKIKMIYRSIHDEKTGRQLEGTKVDMGKDVFQEINRDVEIWAEENKKKIKNLKDQMKFRREFIGNLSHELKTPLTIIQGNILTLLEGAVEDKSIREKFLIKASENVERLENLINDLDNITRLESGAEQIKLERFNVVALTEDVIENLERKAEDADISLAIKKKTPKEIWVNADRRKIDQVITNLLINSINYGKKGGKTSISFDDEGDNILVEIKDNGMGITNEALPRIFERFYRVDKSRARHAGGTGLGLAIVKHILEVHKQPISVTSKVGEGSAFSFTLNKAK